MHLPSSHQPAGAHLSGAVLLTVLCLVPQGEMHAQGSAVFTPPAAYPMERYEAGWNKNPFTLKTAPTVMVQDSFAKDLSIGSYYGETQDPTVVVVNTKTGERIKLKKSQAASNGMQLKSVKLGGSHKDVVVEVTLGSETSEVRFNDDYMRQMAAGSSANTPQGQPVPARQPGVPPTGKPPMPPGQQPRLTRPGGTPATAQVRMPASPQVAARGKAATTASARPVGQPGVAVANATRGSAMAAAANAGQAVLRPSMPVVTSGTSPVAIRRRLSTLPASMPVAP